jgi:hypothetical protein
VTIERVTRIAHDFSLDVYCFGRLDPSGRGGLEGSETSEIILAQRLADL